MKKSQLVFAPYPGMGHLMSTVEFAKLLINHNEHLSITILIIRAPFDPNVDAFTQSLTSSLSFQKRLRFILLPPHPDPTNSQSLHRAAFLDSIIQCQKLNIRDAVSRLNSDPHSPRLAGLVMDMFCATMIDVAKELQVPPIVFFTSRAAFLGFMLHIHTLRERENVDTTAFNLTDSGLEFAVPCLESPVLAGVFPRVMSRKEWALNTFEELESHAVRSFCNSDLTVYPIGPILSAGDNKTIPEGSDVMKWLDDQSPSSVLFLCFGSKGYFEDEKQVRELAKALETTEFHFLWSLRKPPPKGTVTVEAPKDYSNLELEAVLPEGFLKRTAEIGRVIGWAPQTQILGHKAIGGFVSHCGWNSILESVHYGVPIATWPLHSEQQFNAFQLVRELKMSVEMSMDYRTEYGNVSKTRLISAERIEKGIKEVMQKDSEVRKKVKEMREMSKEGFNGRWLILLLFGTLYYSIKTYRLDLIFLKFILLI